MKIAVIGAGVVGRATGLGLARFGHQVSFGDISTEALEKVAGGGYSWLFGQEPPPQADLYLVCTPEEAVPEVVRALKPRDLEPDQEVVIRSSTLPGTTHALGVELGIPIFHNPEFLRAAVALDDFLNARFALIGRAGHWSGGGARIENVYRQMGMRVVWTSSTMSEMVKLSVNCHLSTLISYWNEVHILCEKLGLNSHNLARLAALDGRVVSYGAYKHGEPFGGACLPKDLHRMIHFCRDKGFEPLLLEAAEAVNLAMAVPCPKSY